MAKEEQYSELPGELPVASGAGGSAGEHPQANTAPETEPIVGLKNPNEDIYDFYHWPSLSERKRGMARSADIRRLKRKTGQGDRRVFITKEASNRDAVREVLFSQMYRLLLGERAPKQRLFSRKKNNIEFPRDVLSKQFPRFVSLMSLSEEELHEEFSGTARDFGEILLAAYALGENDAHLGNIGRSVRETIQGRKPMLVKIDHGQSGSYCHDSMGSFEIAEQSIKRTIELIETRLEELGSIYKRQADREGVEQACEAFLQRFMANLGACKNPYEYKNIYELLDSFGEITETYPQGGALFNITLQNGELTVKRTLPSGDELPDFSVLQSTFRSEPEYMAQDLQALPNLKSACPMSHVSYDEVFQYFFGIEQIEYPKFMKQFKEGEWKALLRFILCPDSAFEKIGEQFIPNDGSLSDEEKKEMNDLVQATIKRKKTFVEAALQTKGFLEFLGKGEEDFIPALDAVLADIREYNELLRNTVGTFSRQKSELEIKIEDVEREAFLFWERVKLKTAAEPSSRTDSATPPPLVQQEEITSEQAFVQMSRLRNQMLLQQMKTFVDSQMDRLGKISVSSKKLEIKRGGFSRLQSQITSTSETFERKPIEEQRALLQQFRRQVAEASALKRGRFGPRSAVMWRALETKFHGSFEESKRYQTTAQLNAQRHPVILRGLQAFVEAQIARLTPKKGKEAASQKTQSKITKFESIQSQIQTQTQIQGQIQGQGQIQDQGQGQKELDIQIRQLKKDIAQAAAMKRGIGWGRMTRSQKEWKVCTSKLRAGLRKASEESPNDPSPKTPRLS